MGISGRLREVIETEWGSATTFATMAGIPYRSLQNYLRGERAPSAEALETIGRGMLINVDWLVTGRGHPLTADYPREEWLDAIFVNFLPGIIDMCLDPDSHILSSDEKRNLFGFLCYSNYCGLDDIVNLIIEKELATGYDDLIGKADLVKDFISGIRQDVIQTLETDAIEADSFDKESSSEIEDDNR